ncbi:MAG: tRNA (adenosine(37)-N6)-threonylcarbamoyltransferase complex ATPase subunit type 1 TsaE [Candidatus Nanopelagicales bacterium]|nr:tRNA (adenosine(37)-N6)-threonylcarbamoyltransferase complex ATPase subunit type 1 TsaE [Candidatus Nanopelagicales bacterium]
MSQVVIDTAASMQALGERIGHNCRPGDLVLLVGDLGAGKTTLVQGLGLALGVTERVTSPTFVIARVHATAAGFPQLMHVDAYRLGSALEFDDLDLAAEVDESVTVVEWGEGKAEQLAGDYLLVQITRSDYDVDETRRVELTGRGERWTTNDLDVIAGP